MPHDVLIAGAGPTGLVLALWLTRQGIRVRIVDKAAGHGTASRAIVVHARTLELYRQLDLADAVVAAGHRNPAINLWIRGHRRGQIAFGGAGAKLTLYPFILVYTQDRHERLLGERLAAAGVSIEWQTELTGFTDHGDHVAVRLRRADGSEAECRARYLAGCDGARSPVRHQLGTGFAGGTYEHVFYVADVEASGPTANGEVHIALERADFVAIVAYGERGLSRLIGVVRDEREAAEHMTFADVGQRAIESLGLTIGKVNWFSTYRVHHRLSAHFRQGRAFLLGDAAHVHSPAGGQGMNTGIGDAVNLAWKLAAVLKGEAPARLLDSYEDERQAFARRLVASTDRAFMLATAEGRLADFVRTRIVPVFASLISRTPPLRELMFRTVSQTQLNYRDSALSAGRAGRVHGGDRLPWVAVDGRDNHAPLAALSWQVQVYGAATPALQAWCEAQRMPLQVFAWQEAHGAAGLARDAAYLLRPDSYVALAVADAQAAPAALQRYFSEVVGHPAD
jgi:2-polyprenyl-6-methoxyphenol hydroxylase-like FAD-dependent oxidoreductase